MGLPTCTASFPDDFYKNPLPAKAVKFPVKDLLPRSEVELPSGDRHNDLPAHDRALEVGVGIVLASVVGVLGVRCPLEFRFFGQVPRPCR